MYRFVQIEKRAPAPLIRIPSLKCSQSQVMPQMPFLQAAIPWHFRPTDQMGWADHAIGLQISAWRKQGKASGREF